QAVCMESGPNLGLEKIQRVVLCVQGARKCSAEQDPGEAELQDQQEDGFSMVGHFHYSSPGESIPRHWF
ncbi:MAG: hypothetical protein ACKOCH_08940, partial [Bacteroidota bacterium]